MAHNRTTQFSAPFRRNNLLGLPQYTASDHFPTLGKWDRARTEDLYVVRGTEGRTQPVQMIVIGAVSSDKANLQPHGNFDPTYMPVDQIGRKAKLQFVLTSPEGDADFVRDYGVSLDRLRAVQEEVAGSPSRRDHFIEGNNMKMNFHLFDEKGSGDYDTDEDSDEGSQQLGGSKSYSRVKPFYEVSSCYQDAWDTVSKTHFNNVMEVYGTNELPIDYRNFEKFLRTGALVAVTFTLKHYSIRERGSTQIASDTYCASIITVSILKEAEKKIRRAFNSKPPRRPVPVPQFPTKGTLKMAADTFAPVVRLPTPIAVNSPSAAASQGATAGTASSKPKQATENRRQEKLEAFPPSSAPVYDDKTKRFSQELLDQVIPFLMERMKRRRSPSPEAYKDSPSPLTDMSSDDTGVSDDDDDMPLLVSVDLEGHQNSPSSIVVDNPTESGSNAEMEDGSSWVSVSMEDGIEEDVRDMATEAVVQQVNALSKQTRGTNSLALSSAEGLPESLRDVAEGCQEIDVKAKRASKRNTRARSTRSEGKKARV